MTTAATSSAPSATTLASVNPATGETVGSVPITPPERIAGVVAAARAAQTAWAELGVEGRADALRPAGAKLVERCEAIGRTLTDEMGKPLAEGVGEVRHCGQSIETKLDDIIDALRPERFDSDGVTSHVHHDPFGVAAVITPWNFPVGMPHSMVIPALMAGNTVVLKPSEETPLVAQAYVDVLNESLPAGVLQIVHGADRQGRALVESDVDLIAFTGSRETGVKIMQAAGAGLKRLVLELGGKDPMIVLDDADLDAAAEFAVLNSFRNAGQVCVSTERIYVDERIADRFESLVAEGASALPVGRGTEPGVKVGPMINGRQRDHVVAQVAKAKAQGARVLAGGESPEGNFLRPTVLADVDHDMEIMREETFGPVACIRRVKDADEAVRLANDTPFGLGATVFGRDTTRAAAVARKLTAGMVGINKSCGGAAGTPWVGARQSGFGYHGGRDGHRQFTQARVVSEKRG